VICPVSFGIGRACGTPEDALERLAAAIRDVESELAAMKAEHDPHGYARQALNPLLLDNLKAVIR